jgi:chloramphenicol 3-O-phosphotransferase/catechol 2,3-dioxygenase-like lactoylglutathione lyase family enzyme
VPDVIGFDHIYISVSDVTRSEAFYDRLMGVLGFRKSEFAIGGERHVSYYNRHFGYVLRPARVTRAHDAYSPGLHHLCLRVPTIDDVRAVALQLQAAGIPATDATCHPEYADDYWATSFTDPDGMRLEVTNYREERRRRHDDWDEMGARSGARTEIPGKIILLNGASSSGKSTLARGLQAALPEPFWHFSIDHLMVADVLPKARIERGEFPWRALRPQFFEGFHRCLPALAAAGNNVLVEHIFEAEDWMQRLLRLLGPLDVFFVGLHCPLPELERRERARGDRRIGDARSDFAVAHRHCVYDIEVDTTRPLTQNVDAVIAAWNNRQRPGAFARMAQRV